MRMAWLNGSSHAGHTRFSGGISSSLLAHSMQKRLWPHGTSAATVGLSRQTTQRRSSTLPSSAALMQQGAVGVATELELELELELLWLLLLLLLFLSQAGSRSRFSLRLRPTRSTGGGEALSSWLEWLIGVRAEPGLE